MVYAADDAEAVRAAQDRIRGNKDVTTEDTAPSCPRCGGMGFLFRDRNFGSPAVPCQACRPKPGVGVIT